MSVPHDRLSVLEPMNPSRPDADSPASERILDCVAAAEGTEPADLEERLYDSVDADALHALLAHGSSELAVEFTFCDYVVTVADTGAGPAVVEVAERASAGRD
ncbi:HalOD1 output domain-containing protein [Halobaculum halobium]|uniref:HalOD1 output domain-containing protein n=1 Tax=Halobaculum halobium TaxID=3032281 RepID=A0ABD5TH67_9EURY|nr:HalOD1 output domain-containing protein [Halobaculum sp. SYNS20]